MSDTVQNDEFVDQEPVAEEFQGPSQPGVAAPANALVGDETLAVRQVDVVQDTEPVKAQVTGAPSVPVEEVYVHETHVTTDTVITDPNSPEAVQVPDAGRGFLNLPIHQLAKGTVEEQFAAAAKANE